MRIADRAPVSCRQVNSLRESIEQVYERISRKAFDYYQERGAVDGCDLEDWLRAEAALITKPDVTARLFNEEVFIEVLLPEMKPERVALDVTRQDMLVSTEPDGDGRQIFRVLHLPESIDTESVDAEFVEDSLRITATLAHAG